jgi:surface antigen
MLNLKFLTAAAFSLALALTACEGVGEREVIGTILGGAAGAVAGSQFGKGQGQVAAAAAGAVIGALIGGDIGRQLDKVDRQYMEQTAQASLEDDKVGTTRQWNNPDSGNSGSVTPTRSYPQADETYCREYQQSVTVAGKSKDAYGTACRQPDGTWQIVN